MFESHMSEKKGTAVKARKILEFDPSKIRKGTCQILTSSDQRLQQFVVCNDEGKIKIYPVEKKH
jgi:hypothetical protein